MKKPSILFLDWSTPRPYGRDTLRTEALGGTEATVIRIATALAERGFAVSVYQYCRTEDERGPVDYLSGASALSTEPEITITLRNPRLVREAIKQFHRARKHLLWLHDWAGGDLAEEAYLLRQFGVQVVCVSQVHKHKTDITLAEQGTTLPVTHIYNPVDDGIYVYESGGYQPEKLVFFSSPHKGLRQTLEMFREARKHGQYSLYVSNPGYYKDEVLAEDGVYALGALPHHQSLEHVRDALCVFYPNTVFSETFGLVLAEANALGTPVIAHDFGAAREVLSTSNPPIDCHNVQAVVSKLVEFKENRPKVRGKDRFRLSNIVKMWDSLLTGSKL